MINTMGLRKVDILGALSAAAGGCEWKLVSAEAAPPSCYTAIVRGSVAVVDLHADDGFDETDFDRACGWRAAQRAVDKLRVERKEVQGEWTPSGKSCGTSTGAVTNCPSPDWC